MRRACIVSGYSTPSGTQYVADAYIFDEFGRVVARFMVAERSKAPRALQDARLRAAARKLADAWVAA